MFFVRRFTVTNHVNKKFTFGRDAYDIYKAARVLVWNDKVES